MIFKARIYIIILFSVIFNSELEAQQKNNEIESKIDSLIARMTLEEKIGQMSQVPGKTPTDSLINRVSRGEIGSIINISEPQQVNILQKIAIEKSRLGIPLLIARDVIHGYKTIFPIPLGQAASFNPELVKKGARIAAIEASANGIRWTFAPMIDISRDPRWGRIAESFGEDPYLTSKLGVAMVEGFQGDKLSTPTSIAATAKHFFGYGASEGGKDYNSTNITDRLLRNVYLQPFEAVKNAGVATFMTSFNDNDGIPASGNSYMLRDVLRKEWNFDGFVVSDWESITQMVNHRFSKDFCEAAEQAINAGLDMEMVSTSYKDNIKQLIQEKKVDIETIDNAVRNILRIKFRLGLFDNPYTDFAQANPQYRKDFMDEARTAAEQSVVLLKNEGNVLPINTKKVKTIAIIGPLADAQHDQMGTWVLDGEKEKTVTPLSAIRDQYQNEVRIIYTPGLRFSRDKSKTGFKTAISYAKKADVVLFFGGEESILSGEAHSLADLNLQGAQTELLSALKATGKPLVFVVMAGRPLTIGKETQMSDALLYAWHPGTMGGPALANLIFGKVSPSGKLPVSFPNTTGQIPVHYNHLMTGRPAQKNEILLNDIPLESKMLTIGTTSYYLDAGFDPLFPFGFGLSYSSFSYNNLKMENQSLIATDTLNISVDISNTGKYNATEIVQLYISDKVGSIARPEKELKRFLRINLTAGEQKTINMSLPVSELAFYGIDMKNKVEPGMFELMVGGNSESGLKTKFEVIGKPYIVN